ncbi:MAG: helicase-related protein [Solirubrobacteraceae bacterium]
MTDTATAPSEQSLDIRAADQERLVRHLSEVVRRELAGENVYEPGDRRFIERVKPSRHLQLGVLPPQPAPDPPSDDDDSPASDADQAQPTQRLPTDSRGAPPNMGVDVVVSPDGAGTVELQLYADFAVYVPRYPTVEQQREHWAIRLGVDGALILPDEHDHAERAKDEDPPATAAAPATADGDGHQARGADNESPGAKSPVGAGADGAPKPRRRQRPRQMSLYMINERVDLSIGPISLCIDIDDGRGSQAFATEVQAAIDAQLGPILTESNTVHRFQSGRMTLPPQCTSSQAEFDAAIRDAEGDARRSHPLAPHRANFHVAWKHDQSNYARVHVTFANESQAPRRASHNRDIRELDRDMHLFNVRMRVQTATGEFVSQPFAQAPEDFRFDDLRLVWGHGRNAVVEGVDATGQFVEPSSLTPPAAVITTTWPIFRQRRMVPNEHGAPQPAPAELAPLDVTFASLAEETTWRECLRDIETRMRQFDEAWGQELASGRWQDARRGACEHSRTEFQEELRRFQLGLRALDEDPRLALAFREANAVFEYVGSHATSPLYSWRLFQVVFQVIHCSALYARESEDPAFLSELDTADTLFYPTGGGKTESYNGLAVIAAFYDRLRGRLRGVTTILRFPLRMLSVQQLSRVGKVIYAANERLGDLDRRGLLPHGPGDPFMLGYYAGDKNTPNRLSGPKSWTDNSIAWWETYLRDRPEEALDRRILTECLNPACPLADEPEDPDNPNVTLRADVGRVRLAHVCRACGELPVAHTDEEVFRYLPTLMVCTVDKLASVGFNQDVTHLIAGPAWRCPTHGYFVYKQARYDGREFKGVDRCLAGSYCTHDEADYIRIEDNYDPPPSLQVQDEMHLLQETLGTFDAHYETLYEHLQRHAVLDADGNPMGKPTKLLAATATVERYEQQVRNLYARRAKVFPAPGWTREFSFYSRLTVRASRLYVGALPMLRDAAEFGARVQALLHRELERLADNPAAAVAKLGLQAITDPEELAGELFLYDLSLGYVNRKRDGDSINNELRDYPRDYTKPDPAGGAHEVAVDPLETQTLSSDAVSLAEIAAVLALIAEQDVGTPRPQRLRALVGTSLVSHGVDITRLNLMVVNWMPSKVADYIQATSRAGRSHVGLVIVGHDRVNLRDRSHFHYFLPHHRFLERLVAPVPVNRFAKFAIGRTMTGVVCAIILQGYAREHPGGPQSLERRNQFVRWWNAANPQQREQALLARVLDALGLARALITPDGTPERIFDQTMVDSLAADVRQEVADIVSDLQGAPAEKLREMFNPPPLTSFRDVEAGLKFGAIGKSLRAIEKLTDY